jgi:large subunit ribosomal protein L10
MAKQLKNLMRGELERRFQKVDGGVVVAYRGLDSEKIYDFRKKLREKGARFHVVKNSLALRAFQTLGYEEAKLTKLFDGPVGIVYGEHGAVAAAKALSTWKRESKDKFVEVKGGFLEGDVLDASGIKALESMPSREQLLGMVAGAFQAPMQAFAHRLNECVAKFAYAVNAVKEQKEKQGA